MNLFGASADSLTKEEKIEAAVDPALRWEQIESGKRPLTPGWEMSRAHALAEAARQVDEQAESPFEQAWRGTV